MRLLSRVEVRTLELQSRADGPQGIRVAAKPEDSRFHLIRKIGQLQQKEKLKIFTHGHLRAGFQEPRLRICPVLDELADRLPLRTHPATEVLPEVSLLQERGDVLGALLDCREHLLQDHGREGSHR